MSVYLIHFGEPFGHARHYLGFADGLHNLRLRVAHHATGNGARLMKHVSDAGIEWEVVRVWPDADRTYERTLKNHGGSSRYCPTCTAEHRIQARAFASVIGDALDDILGVDRRRVMQHQTREGT